MALTLPIVFVVFYYLQQIYLHASRQLRILELESRAPVYAHFLETLEGLETIRAFRWQTKMIKENERRLNDSQKPYYLMFCLERWLALVLDLIVGGLATVVVALAISLRYSTSPGLLGVSLNGILCKSIQLIPATFARGEQCLTSIFISFQPKYRTVYCRLDRL